jgi:hypothetical protein
MRKQLPKVRLEVNSYSTKNAVPEFRYLNYDLDQVKEDYERLSQTIMDMQMALDKYNQTEQFDVEI